MQPARGCTGAQQRLWPLRWPIAAHALLREDNGLEQRRLPSTPGPDEQRHAIGGRTPLATRPPPRERVGAVGNAQNSFDLELQDSHVRLSSG